ncbi:MAG: ABC transporter substrate-binding protein, partial [Candidatus Bathyarchaeia archaeon]
MEKFASKSAITKIQAVIIAVIVIIAAVAGVVYYLFSQAPVQAPEYIKIGFPTALSGIIGVFGEPVNWVVGMAEDIVNKDGGIYIADYGKKIPIKVIVRDCESDPDLAASLAAELITKDKVDFMIAYTTPMISVPVTAKCEQYSVPSVGWNLPMAMTEGGPYVWSFDSCWTELENVLAYIEVWNSLGSKTNKRVAIIGDNTADGQMWCPLIKTVSERKGYTVVDYSIAPVGTMDWTPYVLKWKDE